MKNNIEDEAIKYCSQIQFSGEKGLNNEELIKNAFIAGVEWEQEKHIQNTLHCQHIDLIGEVALIKRERDRNWINLLRI